MRQLDVRVPWVVALSPTMRCNYDCIGCYSRGRPEEEELSIDEVGSLLSEACDLGVNAFVVTGGEPLLKRGLLETIAQHQRLLFVLITNGTPVTPAVAGELARAGNIIPLVSIEGLPRDTDDRRCAGAHEAALAALRHLSQTDMFFGFAAMNTSENTEHIGTDTFMDEMEELGCSLGLVTEYVPCGEDPRTEWLVSDEFRGAFRERILQHRAKRRIALIQFPQDEYGVENRCTAAGQGSLHISSTGQVEPCPFVSISCENVRDVGLIGACRSQFLSSIRERRDLLRREKLACSLFEHSAELEELAERARGGAPDERVRNDGPGNTSRSVPT